MQKEKHGLQCKNLTDAEVQGCFGGCLWRTHTARQLLYLVSEMWDDLTLKLTASNKVKMSWDEKNQHRNMQARIVRDVSLEIVKARLPVDFKWELIIRLEAFYDTGNH